MGGWHDEMGSLDGGRMEEVVSGKELCGGWHGWGGRAEGTSSWERLGLYYWSTMLPL